MYDWCGTGVGRSENIKTLILVHQKCEELPLELKTLMYVFEVLLVSHFIVESWKGKEANKWLVMLGEGLKQSAHQSIHPVVSSIESELVQEEG